MGATLSKGKLSQSLPYNEESVELLSTWEPSLNLRSSDRGSNNSSLDLQQLDLGTHFERDLEHFVNVSVTAGTNIKLRFFLREDIKWLGQRGSKGKVNRFSCGIRRASLWVTTCIESENDIDNLDSFQLSVKTHQTVNGDGNDGFSGKPTISRDIFIKSHEMRGGCWGKAILLDENFLEFAVLFRKDGGEGEEEEEEVSLYSGCMQLTVNLAVKLIHAQDNRNPEQHSFSRLTTTKGNQRLPEGVKYLANDLKACYTGNELSDVVLKSNDGVTIHAHKLILAARSPYFRRWIQWNSASFATRAPVTIDDVEASSLFAVLHWMYTGELLEDVYRFREELTQAAIKFEMADLINILKKHETKESSKMFKESLSGGHLRVPLSGKDSIRKLKRAILAWFPLLRYRFGNRPVGLVASIINAVHGIYELFLF